ncbi:MAG: hypothetical protein CGU28_09655 [Candidatus Dactylopiibacterium carminicum]|uniref:Uncharacterized protein n=2 Tax=Candidatus Dactylopiibacterium carminicum TaxID=857335 RepID=A0A272ERV1_9RHOO|nr:hypothetical protein BGI27_10985 [Candidatus Dactylopiibacterium carminicum]PAS92766.1 MAG: hypothetical protein CGU29_10245 [Candidatus Dactylopiibacterium carminicum]PAS96216.1 MAG: hypothetical protein CGU28_09655 [Candidatus Dactylopiibacterium carminicum]PAS98868.1 MAG: hypothetical protein BSR46_11005 [Candidatus Dactylopiibacterium carminicum]
MPPPPGGNQTHVIKADQTVKSGMANWRSRKFSTRTADTSAILVSNGARLTLTDATIEKAGDTSSFDGSSFVGLNAALLANEGGVLTVSDSRVIATGSGANGAFAVGAKSFVRLQQVDIRATGDNAHGVMVAGGGRMEMEDVTIFTSAQRSAAIATDRGSGEIRVKGGQWQTTGAMSPVLYSTGVIDVMGGCGRADAAEAVVIEGSNLVELRDTRLTGARNGAMIYQSFSGDAEGQHGRLNITGGEFIASSGPLLYVTNTHADVTLKATRLQAASGILVQARADRWGRQGNNGGHLRLQASRMALSGAVLADGLSDITLTLGEGARWTGRSQGKVSLSLQAGAAWVLDGDAQVSRLEGADCESGSCRNIRGNGFSVRYDPAANPWAKGRSFSLPGGGLLRPAV